MFASANLSTEGLNDNNMRILFLAVMSLMMATSCSNLLHPESKKVPGVVVSHVPASTNTYIGSPAIVVMPNGHYVASHDYFGPASGEWEKGLTAIYLSKDKGLTWKKISTIQGQFWSNLFFHKGSLYIMGTWKHHGNLVIRRSDDEGKTWSSPTDNQHGLLLTGEYHTAPVPIVEYKGRLWRAIENATSPIKEWGKRYSAMVVSAAIDSDLLLAESWKPTTSLPYNANYLNGQFYAWLEGNAVVTPDKKLVDILRVDALEKGREWMAQVEVSDDGASVSFDPSRDFFEFSGGAKKFTIRFDPVSKRYWTLSNFTEKAYANEVPSKVRNMLVLKSSANLHDWVIHKVLLKSDNVKQHGFQYVDWQFDGSDIIFLSRTAYDDDAGGAQNYHDSNFLTFHRIKNYPLLISQSIF